MADLKFNKMKFIKSFSLLNKWDDSKSWSYPCFDFQMFLKKKQKILIFFYKKKWYDAIWDCLVSSSIGDIDFKERLSCRAKEKAALNEVLIE